MRIPIEARIGIGGAIIAGIITKAVLGSPDASHTATTPATPPNHDKQTTLVFSCSQTRVPEREENGPPPYKTVTIDTNVSVAKGTRTEFYQRTPKYPGAKNSPEKTISTVVGETLPGLSYEPIRIVAHPEVPGETPQVQGTVGAIIFEADSKTVLTQIEAVIPENLCQQTNPFSLNEEPPF